MTAPATGRSSGVLVANSGHNHPRIIQALKDYLATGEPIMTYCFPSDPRARLVKKLIDISPESMDRVFLLTTGSEAVEVAIKLARTHGIRKNPDKYYDHIYGEKELGGTSWMYLSSVSFDQVGFDPNPGNEPIINNVKDFLGTVPMVLAIWPAMFTGFHLLAKKKDGHGDHDQDVEKLRDEEGGGQ